MQQEGAVKQIEWTEVRLTETFRIIAEKGRRGWSFYEKSVWEVRWYFLAWSKALENKAENLALASQQEKPEIREAA